MLSTKGDQGTVRALNRSMLLNLLRREGNLSRVQLTRLTGLSSGAITGIVAELIDEGLIVERQVGSSSGGRPPILLALDYGARAAVGLKVMERRVEAVLTDVSLAVTARADEPLEDTRPATVAHAAASLTRELLRRSGTPADRLVGVGVGLPGVIDSERGIALQTPSFGWRDVPIVEILESAVGCPAVVDNNVNAFAAAERLFGHGRLARNFAAVTVGSGIGAGLVLRGETYRGREGGAGEIGHTVIQPGGRACACGKRGCLEAYASEPALVAQLREADPRLPGLDASLDEGVGALLDAVGAGHRKASRILRDAGTLFGIALANLVNTFNPEMIVIGGEGVRLGPAFFDRARAALAENAFGGLAVGVPVVVDDWGDDAWARGAASLAVQRTFDFTTAEVAR